MKYYASRSYSIALHDDVLDDLNSLYDQDEDAAADIEAFLEEAKNNQKTLENLTRNNYVNYDDWNYDVKEWQTAKKRKLNLWRIRMLWLSGDSAKYRVVYAFHPTQLRYYVLGIVDREFDYDLSHEISKRILTAYDALDIPGY